jgi:hypothetical protein
MLRTSVPSILPGAPPDPVRKADALCGADGAEAGWVAGGSGDGLARGPGDLPGWDARADARGLACDGAGEIGTDGGGGAVEHGCLRARERGERRRCRGAGARAGTDARLPRGGGVRVRGGERTQRPADPAQEAPHAQDSATRG